MDRADEELRFTIKKLWPLQTLSKLNLLVPPKHELHGRPSKRKMTVGKIYAGLLILENYRSYKQTCNGDTRPRKSSFFNRIMGVVRNNANNAKSNSTINSITNNETEIYLNNINQKRNVTPNNILFYIIQHLIFFFNQVSISYNIQLPKVN